MKTSIIILLIVLMGCTNPVIENEAFELEMPAPTCEYDMTCIRARMLDVAINEMREFSYNRTGHDSTLYPEGVKYMTKIGPEGIEEYGENVTTPLWCSEFWAWVAEDYFPFVAGAMHTGAIRHRFATYDSWYNNIDRVLMIENAELGDAVLFDTNDDGISDHTGMFVRWVDDPATGRLGVWTIDGNRNWGIMLGYRDISEVFGIGHLTEGLIGLPWPIPTSATQ